MRMTLGSKTQYAEGSIMETIMDILVGTSIGCIRAYHIVSSFIYTNTIRPIAYYVLPYINQNSTTVFPLGQRPKVSNGTIKVAAVGFGRTGTYSVLLALEELGYSTLHTIHLYSYENEEILHSINDDILQPAFQHIRNITRSSSSSKEQIQNQQPLLGKMNLQLIADSGYEAIADLPFILYYQQIYEQYPDCKFILTTRETSQIWYKSWESLAKNISIGIHLAGLVMPSLKIYSNYLRWMLSYVNHDTSYMTDLIPSDSNKEENSIATYEQHNANVRALIPPDQLLEFNVKDGWGPLCTFLDISKEQCPMNTPFPKSNSRKQMRAQSISAFFVGAFLLYVFYYIIQKIVTFRRHRRNKKNNEQATTTQAKKVV